MHFFSLETRRFSYSGPRFWALALLLVAIAFLAAASSARAAAPIEGIWSFTGGKVAVKAGSGETFTGTVVAPTKFSNCLHPIGEEMWTDMKAQADGSYWGLHQWFFATEECQRNPELGMTAWRVLRGSGGTVFLRVCFSEPGSNSQPTIAPDGSVASATFGCSDSARISALPTVKQSEADKYIKLPSSRGCLGRSTLRVRVHDLAGDPLAKVVVRLKSGEVQRRAKLKRKGHTVIASLNLAGLPRTSFKVTVHAITVLGTHLSLQRKYRRCVAVPKKKKHPSAKRS
jgi:hypothetical protein